MDEYIATLRILALSGDSDAQRELDKVLHCREKTDKTVKNFASRLRSLGTEVNYKPDGSIEFDL